MAALVLVFFICAYYFLKEKLTPTIPAENWANKDLINEDRMRGLTSKEILRNVELGKYYIPKEITQAYPAPHRDETSHKIIIENSVLFESDSRLHGASQAYKWLSQGKYNLNSEEMKIEDLRIKRKWLIVQ